MNKNQFHIEKIINLKELKLALKSFNKKKPFSYSICENFLEKNLANKIFQEFPNYNYKNFWHEYNNPIEVKKTCNDWNKFTPNIYNLFTVLNSSYFLKLLEKFTSINKLYPDYGLNGGGLHIHKKGGKLNYHLDYSTHPKLNYQRKLNLLIYLTPVWKKSFGGELGFWSHNKKNNCPNKLEKKIMPKFNRAILFDTTQNSWHGLVNPVNTKKNIFRKSLAIYYLSNLTKLTNTRSKALFAPTEKQRGNKKITYLIKKRASSNSAKNVYIK